MSHTLAETQRSLILSVLEQTKGIISGPNGAASRLGLPRTTLVSRMQKLGIVQRRTILANRGPVEPENKGESTGIVMALP
jgi:DNA-binding NtrC family response regulator